MNGAGFGSTEVTKLPISLLPVSAEAIASALPSFTAPGSSSPPSASMSMLKSPQAKITPWVNSWYATVAS